MTSNTRLHLVPGEFHDAAAEDIEHHAHAWRRIVRQTFADPRMESLPCCKDLYLVALDFSALCERDGRGAYSSYPRTGRALDERPDPALSELVDIRGDQVSKMLKMLVALGLLRMVRKAAMGRQAEYQTTIPPRGVAEVGECLAVASELGFKARQDASARMARTRRATEARALKRAREVAQKAVDNPVDDDLQTYVPTKVSDLRHDVASDLRRDVGQDLRPDEGPLLTGSFGIQGTTGSTTSAGPRAPETGSEKDDQLVVEEEPEPSATVDGQASGNVWGDAVGQEAIRRAKIERSKAKDDGKRLCTGLDDGTGGGCRVGRKESDSNDLGLCFMCFATHQDRAAAAAREAGAPSAVEDSESPLSFKPPKMPPPTYETDDGDL